MPKVLCSKIAYLIGVKEDNFYPAENERGLLRPVFEEMDKNRDAQIVRDLCILRFRMIRNNAKIQQAFMFGGCNIGTLPQETGKDGTEFELLPRDAIRRLHRNGIDVFMNRPSVYAYLMLLNRNLSQQLDRPAVRQLIAPEVNWQYIRRMFLFPTDTTEKNVMNAVSEYFQNRTRYPYACYINWAGGSGNILINDDQFLQRLYEYNEDYWGDPGSEEMQALNQFLGGSEDVLVLVDCATTDLASLEELHRRAETWYASHIAKIVLLCPAAAKDLWQPLAGKLHAELHTVEETYIVGTDDWRTVLTDIISDQMFVPDCPLILATADANLLHDLADDELLSGKYLIMTRHDCETGWSEQKQSEHLCRLPEVSVPYARKEQIAFARMQARLDACQRLNMADLVAQALDEVPNGFAPEERQQLAERMQARLSVCLLPSVADLVAQALGETPYDFTPEERQQLTETCRRRLTVAVDAADNLRLYFR